MPKDKSLFHYGKPYHTLLDPLMKDTREKVLEYIPEKTSVLDIGCGTGDLCFKLRQQKKCQVVGVDLSLTMINFAKENNPSSDVQFFHQDATDLSSFPESAFESAVISFIIHELDPDPQRKLVSEAYRVAQQVVMVDSNSPLPWNVIGIAKRVIEIGFGFEHYPQFRSFISSKGIMGVLKSADLDAKITARETFSHGCQQVVVISH